MTKTAGAAVFCPPIIRLGGPTNFLQRLDGVMGLVGKNELEQRLWAAEDEDVLWSETDHLERTLKTYDYHRNTQNLNEHYLINHACKMKFLQWKQVVVDYFLD